MDLSYQSEVIRVRDTDCGLWERVSSSCHRYVQFLSALGVAL